MKITSKLTLCTETSAKDFEKAIQNTLIPETKSLLILACEEDAWTSIQVDPILSNCEIPVFGGVFPYIIYQGKKLKQGTLVVGLNFSLDLILVKNLSQGIDSITAQLDSSNKEISQSKHLITIIDGLTKNIECFVDNLYNLVGQNSETLGCGAGYLDFVQRDCLFTNQGLIRDAAIIASLPTPYKSGISHGWEILEGPYLVTSSDGNILETLNYSPAFNIYQEQVEKNSGKKFNDHDFFDLAKTYPFGIEDLEGHILVRDPILLKGDSLVCVGEVPENSMVYLLKGHSKNLIEAAGDAAKSAYDAIEDKKDKSLTAILFDCISRVLFLNDDFDKELESIARNLDNNDEIFGALTLGEIGNIGNGSIELLNKSTVIAVF